jgi:hypothetical protein
MSASTGSKWSAILLGGLMVALANPPSRAEEEKPDPRVYEAAAKVEGKTYAEWSAAWCRWAFRIGKDRNPILDRTGEFAGEGQTGPVWFLAGNLGGKTSRKCVVPAGKPIFFPVIIFIDGAPADRADEKRLAAGVKLIIDRAADLEATLDDRPVTGLKGFRVASGVFDAKGPDNPRDAALRQAVGEQKVAAEGYWLMLKPLPAGKHTLRFKGKLEGGVSFALDVTYELTVEDKK